MATIGTFKRDADNSFTGAITTLTINAKIRFVPVQSDNEKGPSHRLFAGKAEIGAGWEKLSREGRPYISVKLDDPSLAAPIYASLTEADDAHQLVWSRRQVD